MEYFFFSRARWVSSGTFRVQRCRLLQRGAWHRIQRRHTSSFENATQEDRKRIYIQGAGNEGLFLASCICSAPNPPPVTLLVQKQYRLENFAAAGSKITVVQPDGTEHVTGGMKVEVYPKRSTGLGPDILSQFSTAPIFNLITTIRPRFTAESLGEVKHRLSRQSTLLISGFGVGMMKKIFDMHYPNPISRPTFRRAVSGQTYWQTLSGEVRVDLLNKGAKALNEFQTQYRHGEDRYKIVLGRVDTRFRIGPLQLSDTAENPQDVRERTARAQYLTNVLLRAPLLGANEVPNRLLYLLCFQRLVSASVLGPLAVMLDRVNGELFSDPAAQEIGAALIWEAWAVIRQYLPHLELSTVESWVPPVIELMPHQPHPMLLEVLSGRETDIDDLNGWIVNQAKRFGTPCDRHEGMMDLVKAKAEKIKKAMEAEESERAESERQHKSQQSSTSITDIERLDKLELKRMRKAESQRGKLGNQDMPDYTRPLGKKED